MIETKNLSFYYGENKILDDVSLHIKKGLFTAIAGPNGAGKSTLLHILAGIIRNYYGSIRLDDRDLNSYQQTELAFKRAVFFQESDIHFPYTVNEIASMGRSPHQKNSLFLSDSDKRVVGYYLSLLDIDDKKNRKYQTLSGGEKKRVLLAKSMIQEPEILFLDEPLNSLDIHHQITILKFLKRMIPEKGISVIAVFHDLSIISEFCDNVILLKNGAVISSGQPSEIFKYSLLKKVFDAEIYIGINEITGKLFIHPFDTIQEPKV